MTPNEVAKRALWVLLAVAIVAIVDGWIRGWW